MKKIISLLILACMLLACFASCKGNKDGDSDESAEQEAKYNEAMELIDSGDIEEAYEILKDLGSYEPAEKTLKRFRYVITSSSVTFDDDGVDNTFTYDENGLPTKFVYSSWGGEETEESVTEYSYDEKGNIIKQVREISDSYKYTYEYTYDDKDNLIKTISSSTEYNYETDQFETRRSIYEYTYDSKGNMTKEVYTNQYGYKDTTEYTYDAIGNIVKAVCTDQYGIITAEATYKLVYIPFEISKDIDRIFEEWKDSIFEY